VLDECVRVDGADARLRLPRFQVRKRDGCVLLECRVQGFERRLANPVPGGIAEYRFVRGQAERSELEQGTSGLVGERAFAPDHGSQIEQRGLLSREGDVCRKLVTAPRDAVSKVLVVAALAGVVNGLEGNTELAD